MKMAKKSMYAASTSYSAHSGQLQEVKLGNARASEGASSCTERDGGGRHSQGMSQAFITMNGGTSSLQEAPSHTHKVHIRLRVKLPILNWTCALLDIYKLKFAHTTEHSTEFTLRVHGVESLLMKS